MSAQLEWLTATEAASYLRIEPRTLLLWARQGKVNGYVLSGTQRITWRFLRSDLDAKLLAPAVLSPTGGFNERTA
jgi:excisionase family DNA binding protein